ncbi:MAG: serine--tRNA ligase [Bacteroidales bacterium]|jgi:seryl-tRNA synthetase|nr:serine--tRNA ligase [Bacteroidales bacterium]MDD2687560.1 serine--tRNA ligase [Bacteroidales bacterium]MDD3330698.1 serine--tRNA ligase [Bacteroidales bacterium]MDD3692093.1 serine--tRNA ligase [Bacteroidales bacterium]MDD4044853.1 serine--tRNA ligase [Bacteroidales bacterium]
MIHLNYLKENSDFVVERLRIKNFEAGHYVEEILSFDKTRRSLQKNLDDNLAEQNKIAKEIGMLFKQGKSNEVQILKDKTAILKTDAKSIEEALTATEIKLNDILVLLPNIPHASVPKGKSADDNEVVYTYGDINTDPHMLPHWDICEKMKLIDFETGCKITGSGFPVYTGKGAKLQRALINFFLDHAIYAGYVEIQPPYMVNEESAYATGQLPDKEGQMYHVTKDNLYLIPTAEVPVTNIYRNIILKTADLPIKHCAYSACFRREAGSYGKDVRGLNRLHQFDKVEIVQITTPEHSYDVLEEMKQHVVTLLEKLELPFRIVRLCGGDMSFTSALTFDFEVFAKGQQKWLEVSSVSNFESFQANRMKLRYKNEEGKTQLLHTLNGSALALPRIMAALLENHQKDGMISIPKALQAYAGFECIQINNK